MSGLGDYDRWKTDPDWGRREQCCKHCGGPDFECERGACVICGALACTNKPAVCDCLAICTSCNGAGHVEAHDQSQGPNGETFDAECEKCGGTGVTS